ncbi:Clavaminate synthase-like protein [Clavulina sp. PMI_390]|nr:Clavaminate synthase-like protein [Clavulina sp. PMI_390]
MTSTRQTIPTIDLSPFTTDKTDDTQSTGQLEAAKSLVQALHRFGFVKIVGHGFSMQELEEALGWAKRLFALPYEEKMKAPHPPTPIPHRGYSGLGREKVYNYDESSKSFARYPTSRQVIRPFESYEVGGENDVIQPNIWLPDDVLPNFRPAMTALYQRLAGVSKMILGAIGLGLGLDADELAALLKMQVDENCQLRLLHYPPISKQMLENEMWSRLPAHNDWSAFTMLFQDDRGGLELKDPESSEFVQADPEPGALIFNIGDMLQRFTNGYFISAVHRVSVPDPASVNEKGVPVRYSIPFFCAPAMTGLVTTLPRFITEDRPAKYEPVRFEDYGSIASKYQYEEEVPAGGVQA